MKKISTIIIVLLLTIVSKVNAQEYTSPENFDAKKLVEYATWIDNLRPELKNVRQWARNNKNKQAELVTNRLEYWAKDISRYIKKYANSHTSKVCERLLKKDIDYLNDFVTLTFPLLYKQYPTIASKVNAIDLTKYK